MMDRVIFNVTGEPVGKGRPRFYRRGAGVGTYTPDKTIEYEERIRQAFLRAGRLPKVVYGDATNGYVTEPLFPEGVPLKMEVMAVFGIPKSASKKKAAEMLDGRINPTKKPDADNIAKIVADALNGIAFRDDAQIAEIHIWKVYGKQPRITVNLERI